MSLSSTQISLLFHFLFIFLHVDIRHGSHQDKPLGLIENHHVNMSNIENSVNTYSN